jgi:hypothetical protein
MVGIQKIWHPFERWEDLGMWRDITKAESQLYLEKSIEFTGDAILYGAWMLKVLSQFPISCEHHITDQSINRRAWIGHAACYLAIGCPEYITRKAWAFLTEQQQIDANKQADIAIETWERAYEAKNIGMEENMGEPLLPGRHSRGSPAKTGEDGQSAVIQDGLHGYYEK